MTGPTPRNRDVVLTTDRLLLRPLRVADAGVQHQLWTERNPRVPRHRRIDAMGRPSVEDLAGRIRRGPQARSLGLLGVERKVTNDVIGYCGLIDCSHGSADEPELAFELLRRTWQQGYATEASWAVIDWARLSGIRRLWAGVRDWNVASRRVLAKLGFVETGIVETDSVHGDSLLLTKQL